MTHDAFTIDIGERYIKIADIAKKGSHYEAHTLAFNENPINIYNTDSSKDSDMTAGVIQKIVRDAGIKKKAVNIVVPDVHSYSQIIEMPLLTEKELVSAIKYQADQFIPVPIEDVSLDIEVLFEDRRNKKLIILLIATTHAVVEKVTSLVERAGLYPDSIENETSATVRLIADMLEAHRENAVAQQLSLFMNVGYSATSLYLFNEVKKLPVEIRNFSLGVNIFIKDIQANLELPEGEIKKMLETTGFSDVPSSYNIKNIISSPYNVFVSEIERFIIVAKTKFGLPVNSIFLFGEGGKIASFGDKLSTSLGIKS